MNTAPFVLSVHAKNMGPSIGQYIRSSYGEKGIGNARPVRFSGLLKTAMKSQVIVINKDTK